MSTSLLLTRRAAMGLFVLTAAFAPGTRVLAQSPLAIKVYKEATCGCCGSWARHLTTAGFDVSVVEVADIDVIKARLGVPYSLASCHTAEIDGYLIEGHIPAPVIKRLLIERPAAKGLAVPGMPLGSPGMEGRSVETYEVILFGPNVFKTYARCRGAQEV